MPQVIHRGERLYFYFGLLLGCGPNILYFLIACPVQLSHVLSLVVGVGLELLNLLVVLADLEEDLVDVYRRDNFGLLALLLQVVESLLVLLFKLIEFVPFDLLVLDLVL